MSDVIKKIQEIAFVDEKTANVILEKSILGGECNKDNTNEWFENRFAPNIIFISRDDYSKMCISALKTVPSTIATDFGSSRQRDLGQIWGDMTRGYLGEQAMVNFLLEKYNLKCRLSHDKGELKDFLETDIKEIELADGKKISSKVNVGIKTTKWNGIWFDIPQKQFHHSNYHILVKVGIGRDHLFGFMKGLSVFRDKILAEGKKIGVLNNEESENLFNDLPDLNKIPAYVCGFVDASANYKALDYIGKKGRKNYSITGWRGEIKDGDIEEIKRREDINGKVEFAGIGQFSHSDGYLFNTGSLKYKKEDWDALVKKMVG